MRRLFFGAVILASAALAACGGSGGSSSAVLPSQTGGQKQQSATATFVVKIPPKRTTGSSARTRNYLTADVQGIEFNVWQKATPPPIGQASTASPDAGYAFFAISPTSPYCTTPPLGGLVCSLPVAAEPGTDTFVVNTYDQPDTFYGALVSTGQVVSSIAAAQSNTINITTSGIPTFFAMALDNAYPQSAITQQVHFLATDIDANIIVGPYDAPVSVTNSDTSGATALSSTTLNSSADAGALTLGYYGGAPSGGWATITASATSSIANNYDGTQPAYLHVNPQGSGIVSSPSFLEFVSTHDNPQTITLSGVGTAAAPLTADTLTDHWSDPSTQQSGSSSLGIGYGNSCGGIVTVSGSAPTYTITPAGAGICYLDLHDSANAAFGSVAISVNASQPLVGATPAPQFTVTPTQLSFTAAGQSAGISASESGYTGAFTATSGNTNVATVSGSGSSFTVTAVSAGQALITVKDANNHIATATVTVTTTGIPAH
jgi:hypothetical protein